MGQEQQQVAIVVPAYKAELSQAETIALQQFQRVLGHYPKIFMAPQSLAFDYGELGKGFTVERFPDAFLQSVSGYSVLLLQKDFYERFQDYEYILIYQLDAFVFSDELASFCAMGYDYIGAPISRWTPLWHALGARVGNGGLSLRRVAACRHMIEAHGDWLRGGAPFCSALLGCEDAFFAACGALDESFRVPDVRTALTFAVQEDVQHAFRRIEAGWRPFGCHAWRAGIANEVWRAAIEAEGYDLSGVTFPHRYPMSLYYAKANWSAHLGLPLHRICGLLQRGRGAAALALMARCLERFDEHEPVWQHRMESLCCLWWMAAFDAYIPGGTLRQLLRTSFEEGICRSLRAGDYEMRDVEMAEEAFAPCQDEAGHERLWDVLAASRKALEAKTAPKPVQPARHAPNRRIVAISMVKNEMDVIESFVRHTLDFADEILIADHQSTDRTRAILEALREEGLPIVIEDVAAARYEQAEVMTHLLHEAADVHQADLVLPLDADEFLVPTGEKTVRTILEQLPMDDVRAIHWRRYAPKHKGDAGADAFLLAAPLYRASKADDGQKVAVGGALVRREHVPLVQGNHGIVRTQEQQQTVMFGAFVEGVEIAHFFWRSPAQIQSKYAVGWPNIAAKYTVNTGAGGSYREAFGRIRRGETMDKGEGVERWTDCDLRGRVPLPELRCSDDAAPDVLANVMAASEALAEELAETRALASEPLVTTIVPYLGDEAAFRTTFASACAEEYLWREIVVPIIAGDPSTVLASEITGHGARLLDHAEALLSSVHGKYVEWLLPGDTVRPEKLRRMTACMELQPLPYPLLLSDAGGAYTELSPHIDFAVDAATNLQQSYCEGVWERFLELGKYPSRGLAGLLVRKEVFTACRGLLDGFADGRPHRLSMWRALLLAGSAQPGGILGILRDDYTGAATTPTLADIAAHQLDWHALCVEDGGRLDEASKADILDRQRRIGIYLLEHAIAGGEDLATGIWPAYQQMLVAL